MRGDFMCIYNVGVKNGSFYTGVGVENISLLA